MTTITLNDTTAYRLPSTWNELTADNLLLVIDKLQQYDKADATVQAEIKTELVLLLSGLRLPEGMTDITVEKDGETFAEAEIRNKLLPAIAFLFEKNTLTKQLFPKIRIRKRFRVKHLYGPSDNFMNLSFGEFDDAEYFFSIITAQAELTDERLIEIANALNMFCAILYREYEERKGDSRIAYSAHDNEARAEWFSRADANLKAAILFWYIGCRNQLESDFAPLFESKKGSETNVTWTMLAHSLAGPVLGNIDDVFARNIRQVFTEMLRLFNQAEEMEANSPDVLPG